MSSLYRRAGTAVIFVVVMIGGIYGGPYSFVLLFGVIAGLSMWEFFSMLLPGVALRQWVGVAIGLYPYLFTAFFHLQWLGESSSLGLALLLLVPVFFLLFLYELFSPSEQPFTNLGYYALGIIYIAVPLTLLQFMAFHNQTFDPNVVFGLLVMNWMNDTGAYVVGSRFGKTPLFPRISPKKTWEGTIGAIIFTVLVGILLYYLFSSLTLVDWIILALIVAVFGSLGDLVESMLKRSFQLKDSGTLLPGHGGFLDRFDGFLFLLPFAATYLLLIS
ncbi:MAG: CDP-archaeol synthase [Bacteroidota bacterium]